MVTDQKPLLLSSSEFQRLRLNPAYIICVIHSKAARYLGAREAGVPCRPESVRHQRLTIDSMHTDDPGEPPFDPIF